MKTARKSGSQSVKLLLLLLLLWLLLLLSVPILFVAVVNSPTTHNIGTQIFVMKAPRPSPLVAKAPSPPLVKAPRPVVVMAPSSLQEDSGRPAYQDLYEYTYADGSGMAVRVVGYFETDPKWLSLSMIVLT